MASRPHSERINLREALGVIAFPDSPEQRDEAWNEITREFSRLEEQLETSETNLHNARELLKQALDEAHSIRELKVSADAALEAMGERLEFVTAERNDLRERIEKLAGWYGHDLDAALGSNPAKGRALRDEQFEYDYQMGTTPDE